MDGDAGWVVSRCWVNGGVVVAASMMVPVMQYVELTYHQVFSQVLLQVLLGRYKSTILG